MHQFTKENNRFFEFYPDEFFVKNMVTHKVLLHGHVKDGLYHMEFTAAQLEQAFTSITSTTSSWHNKLGHPAYQTLKHVLASVDEVIHDHLFTIICHDCQLSKSHALPYSTMSNNKDYGPLDLIHTDGLIFFTNFIRGSTGDRPRHNYEGGDRDLVVTEMGVVVVQEEGAPVEFEGDKGGEIYLIFSFRLSLAEVRKCVLPPMLMLHNLSCRGIRQLKSLEAFLYVQFCISASA
ncbi:hypothetical protein MKW98_002886 [Papaver atlanticum]|uniref:GAG-pre-integrase domain-containing protein n=1 Tax=Papaver atlanticum TaxID=357466 RepID=A0AAD4XWT2_9MAGN|nr:hypothetical protein MKW98_002886 [Papaver atlanticum]